MMSSRWPISQTSSPGSSTAIQIARSMTCCHGPTPQSPNSKPWSKNTAYLPPVSRHHRSFPTPASAAPEQTPLCHAENVADLDQHQASMKLLNPSQASRLRHRFRFDVIWKSLGSIGHDMYAIPLAP